MRVVITGATGLFGHGLVRVFSEAHEVAALGRAEADLTRGTEAEAALVALAPELIVHAAAIADVDTSEENPALARLVNVEGTRHVARAARRAGAGLVYISTDAVFDGAKGAPYVETDPVNPVSEYGRTKVAAEGIVRELEAHWIIRVSVLFGPGKTNFVEKALRRIARGEPAVAASDQLGAATYTLDAARAIRALVERGARGTFHVSNQGQCTREELAREAARLAGLDAGLVRGKSIAEMGRPGPRVAYSVMAMEGLRSAGVPLPRHWRAALVEYVSSLSL
jgi:dTDP-4-dehydrorhamnose reductase